MQNAKIKNKNGWKKLSSRYVYENPWMKVREDQVIRPDGSKGIYGVVEDREGVCMIPVEEDGKIWLVKHYRYIFDDARWEMMAGDIDQGETPEVAAQRELIEELGKSGEEWTEIGVFRPSDGRSNQHVTVFVIRKLKPVASVENEFDVLEKKTFSLQEIDQMIQSGEIQCGYALNALYFYKLYLKS